MCRIQFLQDWIGKLSLYWIKIVNVINSDYKWETYFSMNKLFDRYASSGIFRFLWKIRIAAHKTAEEPLGAHATRNHSKNVCLYFSRIFIFLFFTSSKSHLSISNHRLYDECCWSSHWEPTSKKLRRNSSSTTIVRSLSLTF